MLSLIRQIQQNTIKYCCLCTGTSYHKTHTGVLTYCCHQPRPRVPTPAHSIVGHKLHHSILGTGLAVHAAGLQQQQQQQQKDRPRPPGKTSINRNKTPGRVDLHSSTAVHGRQRATNNTARACCSTRLGNRVAVSQLHEQKPTRFSLHHMYNRWG